MSMDQRIARALDATGRRLLLLLQDNARLTLAELGRRVGLSAPAVAERIAKLEGAGIIEGYRATVNLGKLGRPIQALVRLTTQASAYPRILELARRLPAIITCHHVSGPESLVMRVAVASTDELERVIAALAPFGATSTQIILSTPIDKAPWQDVVQP